MSTPEDLLIIGAGHLGRRIAKLWREKHASAQIIAETATEASHAALKALNVAPNLAGTETRAFPKVVFCVPPSPFPDYGAAVKTATGRVLPGGRFVFTSSTSVYGDVKFADERAPTTDDGRGKRIVEAENAALASPAGVVVRLPGLYRLDGQMHTYMLSRQDVAMREESTWNLIHYDDAAEAVAHVLLLEELQERVFLATVANEITIGEYVDSALRHPRFNGKTRPQFLKDGPVMGRRHENSLSRRILGWKPRFESFSEFIDDELRRISKDPGR